MINEWIQEYNPGNEDDILQAMREIMQEITLAALSRTDFFEQVGFYGGTALRIFHGLERFSEDLDFSLIKSNDAFTLDPYFSAIQNEFESLGIGVSIKEKEKSFHSSIESAFLKTETIWKELILEDVIHQLGIRLNRTIKIKIEVDKHPPLGFKTEEKLLIRPFSFYVKCFTLPCLFAGKLHALLFRKWNNRVKGRDWYDLEWYIKKGIPLDIEHFLSRATESGDWKEKEITKEQIKSLLKDKIDVVSFSDIKTDVVRFVKDDSKLSIWSAKYFRDLGAKMKFQDYID